MVGKVPFARVTPTRLQPKGPETLDWYWNPNHVSIRFGPDQFRTELKALDANLEVTWNPVQERWLIWVRKPTLRYPLCQGWLLLFPVGPRELDTRVFARLYAASADRWGNAKQYFRAVEREFERDQDRREARLKQDAIDQGMPFFEHSQIKNIGKGNKFSTYHA